MNRLRALTLVGVALAAGGCRHRAAKVDVDPISFASGGRRIEAYVVERRDVHGARPGIVVVHGSGGDRRELLPRAVELARRGAVVILPTEPSSMPPASAPTSVHQLLTRSRELQDADVRAVERAGDVLRARDDVAALGYLGWSAGAKTGALVAARDRRFTALALLSAGAQPVSAFVAAAPTGARAEVRRVLSSIDPIAAISRARPGTVLLEDGTRDEIVPRAALVNVVRAAPPRTVVRWYRAPHALNDRAYRDAANWLYARLQ
jgi:dienelactone hydrolase